MAELSLLIFIGHYRLWCLVEINDIRDGPFNFQWGVMFFFLKNILIPNVAEKNILILVEEKKNNPIQSFRHIT